jgi:hypothetical protein
MNTYFKTIAFILGGLVSGLLYTAHAQPSLFTFTLRVKNVTDPQVFVGPEKRQYKQHEQNLFTINVKQSDYYFRVRYDHNGKSKEAICPISGAPTAVTAIITPQKDGREACITEETSRNTV